TLSVDGDHPTVSEVAVWPVTTRSCGCDGGALSHGPVTVIFRASERRPPASTARTSNPYRLPHSRRETVVLRCCVVVVVPSFPWTSYLAAPPTGADQDKATVVSARFVAVRSPGTPGLRSAT